MYFCMIMNETKRTGYCIFTLIAAVILCIGACSGNKGATDLKGYAIDSIKADTTVYLDKGDGSPNCVLDLNIAYIKKGKHGEMINDTLMRCGILTPDYLSLRSTKLSPEEAVDSFIKRFAGEYKEEYGAMYRSDKTHASSYGYEYRVRTHVENNTDGVLTYIANIYMHGGGEYGVNQTKAFNFSLDTGRMISLNNFFVPGYENNLKEILTEQICEDFDADDIDGLKSQQLFCGIDVYIPENFILEDDYICFIYCESEIASRNMGEIRVCIDYSDIKHIMKERK